MKLEEVKRTGRTLALVNVRGDFVAVYKPGEAIPKKYQACDVLYNRGSCYSASIGEHDTVLIREPFAIKRDSNYICAVASENCSAFNFGDRVEMFRRDNGDWIINDNGHLWRILPGLIRQMFGAIEAQAHISYTLEQRLKLGI